MLYYPLETEDNTMSNKIKCGEYLYKDGIIVKRQGKSFICPSLPQKQKTPYPPEVYEKTFPVSYAYERSQIDEINALKEYSFQKKIKIQYRKLMMLYYMQEIKKATKRTLRKITKKFLKSCNRFQNQR